MSKHTPGPWHIGGRTILRPTLTIFHKPFGLGDVAEVHEEADAHLIAAAPELLEALRSIADCCDEEHAARDYASRQTEIRGIARAAIAKATGEQP